MYRNANISVLAFCVLAAPGLASAGQPVQMRDLADVAGMSERSVRMVLGPARTPYAEYRYTFDRARRELVAAIGAERYRDLLSGKPVRFERGVGGERIAFVVQLAPAT